MLPPITGVPAVWVEQDGGLLDIAVHPRFAENGWVYLAFSETGTEAGSSSTRIIRGTLRGNALVDQVTIFRPAPALYWINNSHFGARLLFDRDGYLFFSIGDRGHMADAQDLASPYGKLHRVHDDGRVPSDNPFVGRAGAVASIWSYGHRNQQGLAIDPRNGDLYATEHGPRGGDELNLVRKGRNYGWPIITYGMNDNGTPLTDRTEQDGLEQPVVYWTPSIAVSGHRVLHGEPLSALGQRPLRGGARRSAIAPARDPRRPGRAPGTAAPRAWPRARRAGRSGWPGLRRAQRSRPDRAALACRLIVAQLPRAHVRVTGALTLRPRKR